MKYVLVFLCVFLTDLHAVDLYVLAKDGLKLRAKPSETGAVLQLMPYGTKVTLVQNLHYGMTIAVKMGEVYGYWQKVASNGKTGYAFDAYLGTTPHNTDLYGDYVDDPTESGSEHLSMLSLMPDMKFAWRLKLCHATGVAFGTWSRINSTMIKLQISDSDFGIADEDKKLVTMSVNGNILTITETNDHRWLACDVRENSIWRKKPPLPAK